MMVEFLTLDKADDDFNSMFKKNNAVELLPSETEAIYRCVLSERRSYECQQSFSNIETVNDLKKAVVLFAHRLESRIAEVGFVAVVSTDTSDPDNFDMYEGDVIEWHPSVLIDRRIGGDIELDHEKKAWEVRDGLADGKPGHYDVNNVWHDDPGNKKVIS